MTAVVNHAMQSTLRMESKTIEVDIYSSGRIGGRHNEIHSDRLLVNDQMMLTQ